MLKNQTNKKQYHFLYIMVHGRSVKENVNVQIRNEDSYRNKKNSFDKFKALISEQIYD